MSSQGRLAKTGVLTRTFRAVLKAAPEELLPMGAVQEGPGCSAAPVTPARQPSPTHAHAVYLCANRVAPAHEGIELGIGDATLIKALAGATGRSEVGRGWVGRWRVTQHGCPCDACVPSAPQKQVKQDYAEKGDLGTLAVASRNTQKTLVRGWAGQGWRCVTHATCACCPVPHVFRCDKHPTCPFPRSSSRSA